MREQCRHLLSKILSIEALKNGVLLGMSLVVALVGSEFLVRYTTPQKLYRFPRGMFMNHPSRQYTLVPNFRGIAQTWEYKTNIRTNALGLREDREYGPKSSDTYRILAIGDSFTMGVGVELADTYVKILEKVLRSSRDGRTYEVINAGVPGYNTQQELTYLQEEGFKLNPDLVLLNFYIGNDIYDNYNVPFVSVIDDYLQSGKMHEGIIPYKVKFFLTRKSHLYHFIWPYQRQLFDPSTKEKEKKEMLRQNSIYAVQENEMVGTMWHKTYEYLLHLKELGRKYQVKTAIVIINDPIQVNYKQWMELVQSLGENELHYKSDNPNKKIMDFCMNLGIPVLDLLPIFSQVEHAAQLNFALDSHWTPRGNILAAEAVYTFLRDQKLTHIDLGQREERVENVNK